MEATAGVVAPAHRSDYLGWWIGLVVGCQLGFWGTVVYIMVVVWGQPHLNFTTSYDVAATFLALQGLLVLAGMGGFYLSLWPRRALRILVWLVLTMGLAAVTFVGAVILAIITGVAGAVPG